MKNRVVSIGSWALGFVLILFANCYAAKSADKILIGATISMSGKYKEPALMMQEAYNYWVQDINARGGLLGKQVELILYDDKSTPETTETLYRQLIEKDNVDLVLSPYSTPLTLKASEVCEPNEKVLLAVAAASKKPWSMGRRYLFQLYAPADRQFVGLLDMMARANYSKLALIYNDVSPFNVDIAAGIKDWSRKFKIEIVYEKSYQNGEEELAKIIEEIREIQPDSIINSAYPPDSYELLRLLDSLNYRPPVLALPIVPAHPDFQKNVGLIADRILGPSQWEPRERIPFPGTKQFIEGFSKFAGHEPSFHATSAYSSCQLLEKAITQTKTLDNKTLRDYIAALDTVTILGRFKVDLSGVQVGHSSVIIQWQNGKKEIVWPRKMRTAEPML